MLHINKIIYSLSAHIHKAGNVLKCRLFIGSYIYKPHIFLILNNKGRNRYIESFLIRRTWTIEDVVAEIKTIYKKWYLNEEHQ